MVTDGLLLSFTYGVGYATLQSHFRNGTAELSDVVVTDKIRLSKMTH